MSRAPTPQPGPSEDPPSRAPTPPPSGLSRTELTSDQKLDFILHEFRRFSDIVKSDFQTVITNHESLSQDVRVLQQLTRANSPSRAANPAAAAAHAAANANGTVPATPAQPQMGPPAPIRSMPIPVVAGVPDKDPHLPNCDDLSDPADVLDIWEDHFRAKLTSAASQFNYAMIALQGTARSFVKSAFPRPTIC